MPINAGDTTAEVKATIDQIIEDAGLDPADNTDTTAATSMLNEIAVLYDLPGLTGRMGGAAAREVINNLEAGVGFSLDAFMAAQADGLYFDTTETDRFFQNRLGVLSDDVGDAISLALDQRTWAGQTLAEVLAEQAELVVNGAFDTDLSGWDTSPAGTGGAATWDAGGGNGRVSLARVDGTNHQRISRAITCVVGRTYRLSVTSRGGALFFSVGTSLFGVETVGATTVADLATGVFDFVATATTHYVTARGATNGATSYADDYSVKEVPGNHGLQVTGTLQPLRQTTGAKFDGNDDNWLTSYLAAATNNFIVALVDVPASPAAIQVVVGTTNASSQALYLGFTTAGLLRVGVGTSPTTVGAIDHRGTEVVVALTTDGAVYQAFEGNDLAGSSGAVVSGINTAVPLRIGGLNNNGSASSFFGGSIKKLVAGREYLDLATYRRIRNALLS